MEDIGTVATLLLFGVGITLYVGSGGVYGIGFMELYNVIGQYDINGILDLVYGALTNIIVIGTVVVSVALSWLNSESIKYTAGIAILTGVASILLTPFTFVSELALPIEIVMLIRGFFNFVLLIAVMQFITEKRW